VVVLYAVHCGSIRQTASILSMSQECLRTGDKAMVHFRFIKHPEYLRPGQRLVFREGRTKAVGNVVSLLFSTSNSGPVRGLPAKMMSKQTLQQQQQVGVSGEERESPFEVSTDKRDAGLVKKGRGRRGGKGRTNTGVKPLAEQNLNTNQCLS
jgi:hypothetical protein